MEQNKLKELILSIRKSRHNMFDKVQRFTQALNEGGVLNIDTQRLSSIIKDVFTKRRAKTFYAKILSNVIGKSNGAGTAPTFACNKTSADGETIAPSIWTLGSEVICNASETSEHFDPYIIFLTDEQKSKFQTTVSSNVDELSDVSEEFQVFPIPDEGDEGFATGRPADCNYAFYGYMLGMISQPDAMLGRQLLSGEYIKVIITYDGVDYVYQS